MTRIVGTRNTVGDGSPIITAPVAGREIRIYFEQVQAEASGGVTVELKGGSTVLDRLRCANDGDGKMRELNDRTCLQCGSGQPVYLALSAAVAVGYVLEYEVVAV